jgi:ribose/xylose/arabinose/galactoside ABC-type transport system permease subunit
MTTHTTPAVSQTPGTPDQSGPDAPGRRRGPSFSRIPAVAMVGFFLVVVVVFFSIASDRFLTPNNATTIISTASVIMLVSLGQLLVVISGGFDLSIGGVVPLASVVFATLTTAGWGMLGALGITLLVGLAVGLANTLFIVRLKINPLITTLATTSVTAGIAFTIAGGQTLSVPAEAGLLGDKAIGSLPWHVLLMVVLVVVLHLVLQHTLFGRRIYMTGGNPEAARLAGVRTLLIGGSVYSISAVLAALAGVVLASQLLAASGGIGANITMQSLAAVVLGGAALTGGRGTVIGAVIGVLLLGVIANGMTILLVPSFYQQVVTGLVLLAAVTLSRFQDRSRRVA